MGPSWDSLESLQEWLGYAKRVGFWGGFTAAFAAFLAIIAQGLQEKFQIGIDALQAKENERQTLERQARESELRTALDTAKVDAEQAKREVKILAENTPVRTGALTPDEQPVPGLETPESKKRAGLPEATLIFLGGTLMSSTTNFPFAPLMDRGEWMILLGEDDSKLWVSAKFFGSDGHIVCELDKNEFFLNQQNVFRIKKTSHRLTVINQEAIEVLDVHFLNANAIAISGDFFTRRRIRIVMNKDGVTTGPQTFSNFTIKDGGIDVLEAGQMAIRNGWRPEGIPPAK